MQNALRKQHLQEVELERAEVTDEGKWEVGQDIKEAWGIERGTRTKCVIFSRIWCTLLLFIAQ